MSFQVFSTISFGGIFSAEQNYLVNFGRKPYLEVLCENVLNWASSSGYVVSSFSTFSFGGIFSAEQNYLVNFDGKPYEVDLCENI